jgi:hypothetical protein
MLGNEAYAAEVVQMLPAASRGAGAQNGAWLAAGKYEGELLVLCNTGAVTGSVTYKLQDADDGAGTGAADVAGASVAGAANSDAKIVVDARAVRPFVRAVATVVTGPVLCGVTLASRPKNF